MSGRTVRTYASIWTGDASDGATPTFESLADAPFYVTAWRAAVLSGDAFQPAVFLVNTHPVGVINGDPVHDNAGGDVGAGIVIQRGDVLQVTAPTAGSVSWIVSGFYVTFDE